MTYIFNRSAGSRLNRNQGGFTLVELMIAVLVISILAAIAIPQYSRYAQSTHRASAQVALQQLAQWLERVVTANGTYPAANAVPSNLLKVEGERYTITYVPANNFSTYILTATAKPSQDGDGCGNLTLNQQGLKGVSQAGASIDECWTR